MSGVEVGIGGASSLLYLSWKIAAVVYEFKAVGEKTRDLLDTTHQVSSSLQSVKVLRRQKSAWLNATEKKMIDDALQAGEKAVGNVAALIEPARVDMQTGYNKIGVLTRGQFVLRDNPKVQVQIGRLNIASQAIHASQIILCNRERSIPTFPVSKEHATGGSVSLDNEPRPPPSYETVNWLDNHRESIIEKWTSRQTMTSDVDQRLDTSLAVLAELCPSEEEYSTLPSVEVADLQPTSLQTPYADQCVDCDGLSMLEKHPFWNGRPSTTSTPDMDSVQRSSSSSWSNLPPSSTDNRRGPRLGTGLSSAPTYSMGNSQSSPRQPTISSPESTTASEYGWSASPDHDHSTPPPPVSPKSVSSYMSLHHRRPLPPRPASQYSRYSVASQTHISPAHQDHSHDPTPNSNRSYSAPMTHATSFNLTPTTTNHPPPVPPKPPLFSSSASLPSSLPSHTHTNISTPSTDTSPAGFVDHGNHSHNHNPSKQTGRARRRAWLEHHSNL